MGVAGKSISAEVKDVLREWLKEAKPGARKVALAHNQSGQATKDQDNRVLAVHLLEMAKTGEVSLHIINTPERRKYVLEKL